MGRRTRRCWVARVQAGTAYPDWRDCAAYAPLIDADRSLFAWEWLRRDGGYRGLADRALSRDDGPTASVLAKPFGLVAFERPEVAVPYARPVWRSEFHPSVLWAERGAGERVGDIFDLERFRTIASVSASSRGAHLLLSDGLRAIRVDGPEDVFTSGPACLRYRIEGLLTAQAPLLTLRRLVALCRTGQFSSALHAREVRARRWILMLRARDALAAGANHRAIAGELFGRSVSDPQWRTREPSVRSQVQRLVRSARLLAGGYRGLLL